MVADERDRFLWYNISNIFYIARMFGPLPNKQHCMKPLKAIQKLIHRLTSIALLDKNKPSYRKCMPCLHRSKIILLLFFTPHLLAYTAPDDLSNIYAIAKNHYELEEYQKCQDTLQPYLTADVSTPITPYVLFYYALSAYKNGMPDIAEESFLHLLIAHADWEKVNEVLYWLAQLRFEKGDYQQAFIYLDTIKDVQFVLPIQQMKRYFLQQGLSPYLFTTLLNQYPEDNIIAQEWLKQQIQLPLICQDKPRMQQVAAKWKLLKWLYDPLAKLSSIKKDTYHVAVFLPFFIDTFNYDENTSNYFIIDLYQGIQAAVTQLQQEGKNIIIHAYDTQKNAAITAALLEQEELKNMNLFIGPLYAETVPLVADFAKEHGINLFNPLSSNAHIVGNNPFVYLLQPSIETQVKAAADFTLQQAQNAPDIKIGVVYTDTPQDSYKANLYKAYIEQHSDVAINAMLALDFNTLQELLNSFREKDLQNAKHYAEVSTLKDLTHIYIASQDELLVANILSIVQISNPNCRIIGDEIWLKKAMITGNQLQQMHINFIAPTYIDYTADSLRNFRKHFYTQFKVYPNYYATIGYDMMYFLGTMLHRYGTYFQKHWQDDIIPGQVLAGFQYGNHHDNQHVPIIRFKDEQFIIVNHENFIP